jgi:hypothetical protein
VPEIANSSSVKGQNKELRKIRGEGTNLLFSALEERSFSSTIYI